MSFFIDFFKSTKPTYSSYIETLRESFFPDEEELFNEISDQLKVITKQRIDTETAYAIAVQAMCLLRSSSNKSADRIKHSIDADFPLVLADNEFEMLFAFLMEKEGHKKVTFRKAARYPSARIAV